MNLVRQEKELNQNLLNRLQSEDFRTYSLLESGKDIPTQQPVSMTDEAELERLGAQGLGDTIYDDATDTDEVIDFLNEFSK